MGIIYMATSPSGRAYIGQTRTTVAHRWAQHVTEAKNCSERGCRRLNAAIMKYGENAFSLLVCWVCDDDAKELDEWETFFIELFDTLHPGGYNLTEGGQSNRSIYSLDTRQRMSVAKRVNTFGNTELPPGVTYVVDGANVGFRVRTGDRFLRVMDKSRPTEVKLAEALSLYRQAQEGTLAVGVGRKKSSNSDAAGLPKYVTYNATRGSFSVQKPGFPRKSFGANRIPKEEASQRALEYLNNLTENEHAVQRLNGCGGAAEAAPLKI